MRENLRGVITGLGFFRYEIRPKVNLTAPIPGGGFDSWRGRFVCRIDAPFQLDQVYRFDEENGFRGVFVIKELKRIDITDGSHSQHMYDQLVIFEGRGPLVPDHRHD